MGEVDLEVLIEAGGSFSTGVWIGTFYVLIVLVMLNMLLAIIFENYTNVLTNVGPEAKTMTAQAAEIFRHFVQARRKQRVTRAYILETFRRRRAESDPAFANDALSDQMTALSRDHEYISLDQLLLIVGMPPQQAPGFIHKAWGLYDGMDISAIKEDIEEDAEEEEAVKEALHPTKIAEASKKIVTQ